MENPLAVGMVKGLDSDTVALTFKGSFDIPCMALFIGLIFIQCGDYLARLDTSDPEYERIVRALAELTGLANGGFSLGTGEVLQCIKEDIVPVNIEFLRGSDIDPEKPLRFITRDRFEACLELAGKLMCDFENPKRRMRDRDSWADLLLSARETATRLYEGRKFALAAMRTQGKRLGEGNPSLNFDL